MKLTLSLLAGLVFSSAGQAAYHSDPCLAMDQTVVQMNVAAQNIANSETTNSEFGGPYKRRVAFCFSDEPGCRIVERKNFRNVRYPNHPDSDEYGTVVYPNINTLEEMADMISYQRAYEMFSLGCRP